MLLPSFDVLAIQVIMELNVNLVIMNFKKLKITLILWVMKLI